MLPAWGETVQPDVTIAVVSYNSMEYLPRCLTAALESSPAVSRHVIVVDNASSDGSLSYALSIPDVTVIANAENRGFAAANNQAIAQARGRHVLLLNPDAFLGEATLQTLLGELERVPGTAAVGPRLLNPDGSLQPSIGWFPTAANVLGWTLPLGRLFPGARAFAQIDRRLGAYSHSHDVEWLFGAVLLLSGDALRRVGHLDERFFVFCEEQDWCLRAHEAGFHVRFAASSTAVHVGRRGPGGPAAYRHLIRSKLELIRKHRGPLAAALATILMGMRLTLLVLISLVQRLVGRASATTCYVSGLREVARQPWRSERVLDVGR